MIEFDVRMQKSAIGKADEQGQEVRETVYYPGITNLGKMDVFKLIEKILQLGSTAFTKGEWVGVATDLGSSIASQLIDGYKVSIDGLGTFEPVLKTSQKNIKDPSKINSSNFTCEAKFTPDAKFLAVLAGVVWKKKTAEAASSTGSSNIALTFVRQDSNSNLKFTAANNAIMQAWNGLTATATVNGNAVGSVSMTESGIFLNSVIAENDTLTNATVVINLPQITVGSGDEAVVYPAQTQTITGVSQTGPVSGGESGGLGG